MTESKPEPYPGDGTQDDESTAPSDPAKPDDDG